MTMLLPRERDRVARDPMFQPLHRLADGAPSRERGAVRGGRAIPANGTHASRSLADHVAAAMRRYPRARPLPAQQRIAEAALAEAVRAGLSLPPHIGVEWFAPPRELGVSRGEVEHRSDGRSTILLSTTLMPAELRDTMLHELMHIADHQRDPHCRRWGADEREQRARAFVLDCNAVRR